MYWYWYAIHKYTHKKKFKHEKRISDLPSTMSLAFPNLRLYIAIYRFLFPFFSLSAPSCLLHWRLRNIAIYSLLLLIVPVFMGENLPRKSIHRHQIVCGEKKAQPKETRKKKTKDYFDTKVTSRKVVLRHWQQQHGKHLKPKAKLSSYLWPADFSCLLAMIMDE